MTIRPDSDGMLVIKKRVEEDRTEEMCSYHDAFLRWTSGDAARLPAVREKKVWTSYCVDETS